ncbi:MAG: bifunctional nuclease family protein [Elusimicrobiota bacterium]
MISCKIETVTFDDVSHMGVVLLTEKDGRRVLPVWVGLFEAQAILFRLQNSYFPRPLTHDLLKNCIERLNGQVEYILINRIENNTFYAQIHIKHNNNKIVIDSRPSDAIALAVRVETPIYVEEKLFETNGVDKEEFLKEQREKLYKLYLEATEEDEEKTKH